MKPMQKFVSSLLLCFLFLSTILLPGSAQEAPAGKILPPSLVLPGQLTVLPDEDGGFYLVSSDMEQTVVSYLDGATGSLTHLSTLPLSHNAADLQGDRLFLACPYWFSENGNAVKYTILYCVPVSGGEPKRISLFDTYIQNQRDFTALPDGFAAVDSRDCSHIRLFDAAGNRVETLAAGGPLFQIGAGASGRLYASGSQGEFYVKSGASLLPVSGENPSQPFFVLGDTHLAGYKGDLWTTSSGEEFPTYCYETLAQDGRFGLSSHGIVLLMPDRLLLLDAQSGTPTGQIPFSCRADDRFFVSGGTALVMREEKGKRTAFFIPLKNSEPVIVDNQRPEGGFLLEEDLLARWEEALPQGGVPAGLFDQPPDLSDFSTAGRLSVESRAYGLRAVNFYRALYGDSPLSLDEERDAALQYGAVLSLYQQPDSSFQPPLAMGDAFLQLGQSALAQPRLFSFETSASYPLADGVHRLFREHQAFREALLAAGEDSLSLACVRLEDGRVRVFVAIANTEEPQRALTYPPPGYYPAQLISSGEWSAVLPDSIQVDVRERPSAVITDLTDGSRLTLSPEDGLRLDGRTLYLSPPQISAERRYRVTIAGLAENGLPAALEWEVALTSHELTPPVLLGDVTQDGLLTSADMRLLLDYLLGRASLSSQALKAADVTQDGAVDTIDLLALQKLLDAIG